MILKLDYTQQELKELGELYDKYYALPFRLSGKQEVIDTWNAIKAIHEKAEHSCFEYYKTRLNELVVDIQDEFILLMITISGNNPDFEFPTYWVGWAKDTLSRFIDWLDENTREQVRKKLDFLYEHRKSILGSHKAAGIIAEAEKRRQSRQESLPKTGDSPYVMMRHNEFTSALMKIKTDKTKAILNTMAEKETFTTLSGNVKVDFTNFSEIKGFRISTFQLLIALLIEFTERGAKDPTITFTLKKYMELRGLKDYKSARKQVEEDLKTLFNAYISLTTKKRGPRKGFCNIHIASAIGIERGIIYCKLDDTFLSVMGVNKVMPINIKLLAIDDRYNKSAFCFLLKLFEHKNMNFRKSNANTISVESLLNVTQEIPTYDKVTAGGRHYKQQIIDPFERNMEVLEKLGLIKEWEYCHANGEPLTDDELRNWNYDIFIKLLIKYELNGYPPREAEQPKKPKNARGKKSPKTK